MKRKARNAIGGITLKPYLWMVGITAAVGILLCLFESLCIHNEYIDITVANKSCFVIHMISAAVGSVVAFRLIERGDWIPYVSCILLPVISFSVISSLVFEMNLSALGWGSLSLILGGLAGFYLASRKYNRKFKRNKRYLKR